MALGSSGSSASASSIQAANSRNGSSAAVKSPAVNPSGVLSGRVGHSGSTRVVAWVDGCAAVSVIVEAAVARLCCRPTAAAAGRRAAALSLARLGRLQLLLSARTRCSRARRRALNDRGFGLPRPATQAVAALPPDARSCVCARGGRREVLARSGKDASVPWENPNTGARGTVTPIAAPIPRTAPPAAISWRATCATGTEAWLQGEACRSRQGKWEVRKPDGRCKRALIALSLRERTDSRCPTLRRS